MKPFVKWVGGKRQLLPVIKKLIPRQFNTYYEPFIGGGALFFDLAPNNAVVSDSNEELINVYNVIKNSPIELIKQLSVHEKNHDTENSNYFYQIRGLDRQVGFLDTDYVIRAARTIYLNKTCFNGLYRVNKSGQFNSPFGTYSNPKIVDSENILSVHKFLINNKITIESKDFSTSLKSAKKGDFVYIDPPYDTDTGNFTAYTNDGFDRFQQRFLSLTCERLHKDGVKFMMSNAPTDFILDEYSDYNIEYVNAKRLINSKTSKRSEVKELIITNY